MDITEKLQVNERHDDHPSVTKTLNLSTWSNRSHVNDAIPQNRLIQPSSFDYEITPFLSCRTLDNTEIKPQSNEAKDIQFVASSVSVAGFRGYSVYVAGLFGLSMDFTKWLCGFPFSLSAWYLSQYDSIIANTSPLCAVDVLLTYRVLVFIPMSLESEVVRWVYRCAPYVLEREDAGGFHELDSLFYLYHPNHNSVELSLVFRVALGFHCHVGSTYSPNLLFSIILFVQFNIQCARSPHCHYSTCVLSTSVLCFRIQRYVSLGVHWNMWLSLSFEWI